MTPTGSSLARKFSTKKLFLGGSRKTVDDNQSRQMEISKPLMSPTYLNGVNEERTRPESPRSPTKTVIPITPGLSPYSTDLNSSSLSVNTSLYTPTTSLYSASPITPRRTKEEESVESQTNSAPRKRSNSSTEKEIEKELNTTVTSSLRGESRSRTSRNKDGVANPMKSFRVNLDDPCWKVLPAAMKKYDVKGREEDYRLYITYGDTGNTHLISPRGLTSRTAIKSD
jgi:hypothetical protein